MEIFTLPQLRDLFRDSVLPNRSRKYILGYILKPTPEGDRTAEEELIPQVYVELPRLAITRLQSERSGHTLQATALVHEVYLRLCRTNEISWQNRAHFFRVAARLMRRILVDYARQRNSQKRNEGGVVPLDEAIVIFVQSCSTGVENEPIAVGDCHNAF